MTSGSSYKLHFHEQPPKLHLKFSRGEKSSPTIPGHLDDGDSAQSTRKSSPLNRRRDDITEEQEPGSPDARRRLGKSPMSGDGHSPSSTPWLGNHIEGPGKWLRGFDEDSDDGNSTKRWVCPQCTIVNNISDEVCDTCRTPRPDSVHDPPPLTSLKGSDSADPIKAMHSTSRTRSGSAEIPPTQKPKKTPPRASFSVKNSFSRDEKRRVSTIDTRASSLSAIEKDDYLDSETAPSAPIDAFMTDAERRDRRQKFLAESFPLVDELLNVMKQLDPKNQLSQLLLETSLTLRELLNCYDIEGLHNVALESLNKRHTVVRKLLNGFSRQAPIKFEDVLDCKKEGQVSWKKKLVSVKLEALHFNKKPQRAMDLRSVVGVQELHNGKDAEFKITTRGNDGTQNYYYKATSDAKRQKWMNLFHLYQQRNKTQYYINKLSFRDKLLIFTNIVHSHGPNPPYPQPNSLNHLNPSNPNPTTRPWDKSQEFLFATQNMGKLQLNRGWMGMEPRFGISERFAVKWPQVIGKDKSRLIEVDLSVPHTMHFFKKEGEKADLVFDREAFLDYKVNIQTRKVELSFLQNSVVHNRKYVYPSITRCRRFLDLMMLFQTPPDDQRIGFLHQDALHFLNHLWSSVRDPAFRLSAIMEDYEAADRKDMTDQEFKAMGLFRQQLHNLLVSMEAYAPKNSHCQSLKEFSHRQRLNQSGDVARLQALVGRLYAILTPEPKKGDAQVHELKCTCLGKSKQELVMNDCQLQLIKSFLHNYGLESLRRILQSRNEELQKWALRAIFKVFTCKHLVIQCQGTVVTTARNKSMWGGGGYSTTGLIDFTTVGDYLINDYSPDNYPFPWYVTFMSQHAPLRVKVVEVLFEILVGKVRSVEDEPSTDTGGEGETGPKKPLEGELKIMNQEISHPWLLPLILFSLNRSIPEAQEAGLKNFILLLETRPDNSQAFFSSSGWQQWILPLFQREGTLLDIRSNVFKLSLALLKILLYTWMNTHANVEDEDRKIVHIDPESTNVGGSGGDEKSVSSSVSESLGAPPPAVIPPVNENPSQHIMFTTMQMVALFPLHKDARGWTVEAITLVRAIMSALLSTLSHRASTFTNNFDYKPRVWNYMYSLLEVVEEFMFYRPECKEPLEDPTSPTIPTARLSQDKNVNAVDADLHLEPGSNICGDVVLTERVVDLLTSFRIKRDPTQMMTVSSSEESAAEKEIKKRGNEEFLFWEQIHRYLQMFNTNADNPKARTKLLEQISTVLSEHNKKSHFSYRKNKKIALELKDHNLLDSSRARAYNSFSPSAFLGLTTTPLNTVRTTSMSQHSVPIPQLASLNQNHGTPSKNEAGHPTHTPQLSGVFGLPPQSEQQRTPGHKRSVSELPSRQRGISPGRSTMGLGLRHSSLSSVSQPQPLSYPGPASPTTYSPRKKVTASSQQQQLLRTGSPRAAEQTEPPLTTRSSSQEEKGT